MLSNLRIGIDARMYSTRFTGIGQYVAQLINHLSTLVDQHSYYIFLNQPEFESFQPPDSNFHKVLANAPYYSCAEQTSFLNILNKHSLDLVHFTHFNAPIFYRKPAVVTIHDLTLSKFPGQKLASPLHRIAYQMTIKSITHKAKEIIAVSRNTAHDLQRLLHIDPHKINIIHEAAANHFFESTSPERRQQVLQKFHITTPFLLYTGVWRNHKNLPRLIKAFNLLQDRHPELSLVITGKKDPAYPEVLQTISQLHLQNKVITPGFVSDSDLVPLLQSATIYTFPSLYEGFGLPVLEALASGVPVACSNTSSLPEIAGDSVVYFDPLSIDNIADQLHLLLSDHQLRSSNTSTGRTHARQFSWSQMTKKTLAVYSRVLQNTIHTTATPRVTSQ